MRREIAQRMHDRLELVRLSPNRVLDAGCGEGADLARLQTRFPGAHIIGADLSPAMLRHAGSGSAHDADLICCDFAQLPLPDGALEMLWSNLSLHWYASPEAACVEWRRVLSRGGLLMFSCFGTDTMAELQSAFVDGDATRRVMPFPDMRELGDMLVAAGFPSPVLDRDTITVTYADPSRLLADVRAFGGNALYQRRRGLQGRHAWTKMLQTLEEMREPDGRIALRFEIVYGHAFRDEPAASSSHERPLQFMPRRLIADD